MADQDKIKKQQEELLNSINNLKSEKEDAEKEVKRLDGQIVSKKKEVNVLDKNLKRTETIISEQMEAMVSDIERQKATLKKEKDIVDSEMKETEAKRVNLIASIKDLEIDRENVKVQSASMTKTINTKNKNIDTLDISISEKSGILKSTEKSLKILLAKKEDIAEEIRVFEGIKEEIDKLETKVKELNERLGDFDDEIVKKKEVLKTVKIETNKELKEIDKATSDAEVEYKKIRKELDGMIKQRINAANMIEQCVLLKEEVEKIYDKAGIPFPLANQDI